MAEKTKVNSVVEAIDYVLKRRHPKSKEALNAIQNEIEDFQVLPFKVDNSREPQAIPLIDKVSLHEELRTLLNEPSGLTSPLGSFLYEKFSQGLPLQAPKK